MSDTVELEQLNPEIENKLEKANKIKADLEQKRIRVEVDIENAERKMDTIATNIKENYGISIEEAPDFIKKSIPERNEAITKYYDDVMKAEAYFNEHLLVR